MQMNPTKKFVILSLSIIFLLQFNLQSQQDETAHRRYWFYRTRLINDFMKIGKNQGECIVISERNQGTTGPGVGPGGTTAKIGNDQIDLTNIYLATLALEYKLLTRNSQSTDETIKEIFHLLYSINRLDLEAEFFWNASFIPPYGNLSANGALNGYIMREDFPTDFIWNNIGHYNYSLLEDGYNGSNLNTLPNPFNTYESFSGLPHVSQVDGDTFFEQYLNSPIPANKPKVSLVQDKFFSMFFAFMCLVKYIPNGTIYYENGVAQQFQDGGYGIKEQAQAITNRIFPYLQGNVFSNPTANDWLLEQPDGSNVGPFAGAGIFAYSWPVHRAVCHINNNYPWNWTDICTSYSDVLVNTVGLLSYMTTGNLPIPAEDQALFQLWNQASSNYPVFNIVAGSFPPSLVGVPVTCDLAMIPNVIAHDLQWASLARKVLFQSGFLFMPTSTITNPLNVAPSFGPFNFPIGTPQFPDFQWSSPDRTEHPKYRGNPCWFPGNYPGIDFMFLHNLYYEYLNQEDDIFNNQAVTYKNAYNLMDNYDEFIWPKSFNAMTIGIQGNKANVKVFQNLESRALIYATASPFSPMNTIPSDVEYRAGKEIALLPETTNHWGFTVEEGSNFNAYIRRYKWTNGDYGGGLKTNGDPNQAGAEYENDEMNTTIAIHTVDHPMSDSDLHPGLNEQPIPNNFPQSLNNEILHDMIAQNNEGKALANSLENLTRLSVMPNPNSGQFKVVANTISDQEVFELTLFDTKGEVLEKISNFLSGEFDLSQYSKGLYLIKLTSNFGYNYSKKISVTN